MGMRGQIEKLQLDSGAYWSCRLPCRADSHVDDEGVAALVDALCRRRRSDSARPPYLLSRLSAELVGMKAMCDGEHQASRLLYS